jgi:hypothetical protein
MNSMPALADCLRSRREPACTILLCMTALFVPMLAPHAMAQSGIQSANPAVPTEDPVQQMQRLESAVNRSEAHIAASERELQQLRRELNALRQQLAANGLAPMPVPAADESTSTTQGSRLNQQLDNLAEHQAIQQTQIATQEQSKVESDSKYPVKLTGLILLNGFGNSKQVDLPVTPTFALAGGGSAGASVVQSVLGLDARGPHLWGATSSADVRIDFYGGANLPSYLGNAGIVRLRTAHASLLWPKAELFFNLDRPIISPNTPTSLTSVAYPALSWSGNLWAWNPQFGGRYDLSMGSSAGTGRRLRLEAALIDPADPPYITANYIPTILPSPSSAERSSRLGAEARVALVQSTDEERGAAFGIGGYFSPHRTPAGTTINAWAGTLDYRLPLPLRLELSGSAFRGAALGGLGAGAYKDVVSRIGPQGVQVQVLDDVGGWAQLKQRVTERLEWNAAYGIDNAFAGQLRPFATGNVPSYDNIARNRTFVSNFIYSPSTYLSFTFEYRHLQSSPVNAPTIPANVYGAAAAYKF